MRGEVSNCKYHTSGHIYFTIKDRFSALACVMFAGNRSGLDFRLEQGQQVIVFGSISVYERDGKYQLYARQIARDGVGALYEKFEALKKRLEEEGIFSQDHKRRSLSILKRWVLSRQRPVQLSRILLIFPAAGILFCSLSFIPPLFRDRTRRLPL